MRSRETLKIPKHSSPSPPSRSHLRDPDLFDQWELFSPVSGRGQLGSDFNSRYIIFWSAPYMPDGQLQLAAYESLYAIMQVWACVTSSTRMRLLFLGQYYMTWSNVKLCVVQIQGVCEAIRSSMVALNWPTLCHCHWPRAYFKFAVASGC